MQRFHKPDDEKRMVMIVDPDQYQSWLDVSLVSDKDVYWQYAAELLAAHSTGPRGSHCKPGQHP
ncbi:hypothetical protein [Janthinobacterium sp. FT14W]|uniref:hypothetical protein n=1 Tax=Janthinobacterium sp. FT14W TaxID=2654253 RepID=UPI001D01BC71|nr:hypothetical protein [Janthinobacterium sp. FT14W]